MTEDEDDNKNNKYNDRDGKDASWTDTKAEIWSAYKEVIKELKETQKKPAPQKHEAVLKKVTAAHDQLKTVLSDTKTTVTKQLDTSFSELVQNFSRAEELLRQLQQAIERQQEELAQQREIELEKLAEEKAELGKERTREQEEYEYEFTKRKKRQEEELTEKREKVESELAIHKKQMQEEKDELASLRAQVKGFDEKLAREIEQATNNLRERLTREHEHEKALTDQKHAGELALRQQQIDSLNSLVKNQDQEIKRLQSEITQANKQVTRIAERAVTPKESFRTDEDEERNRDKKTSQDNG